MKNTSITENEYKMSEETLCGTLFTTSNGYLGVRGSLEENATLSVQGAFVRGLIDEIPFRQDITIDNEYMRKYYINEDAAKDAEVQEGIINYADILFVRISIDGETFYPWEGELLKWERTLDFENDCLRRCVLWKNTKGDITKLEFERFASFANDHIYAIRVRITPQNHNKEVRIISGADLRCKSNGFPMCILENAEFSEYAVKFALKTKGKYAHRFNIGIVHSFLSDENTNDGKFLCQGIVVHCEQGKAYTLEKRIFVCTSRDTDGLDIGKGLEILHQKDYSVLFAEHLAAWRDFFPHIDIKIEGDDRADTALRFCNYHTAISLPKNDSVHGLGAKNLTGEAYNNYVWWDCEVYQCPVFFYAGIESIKNVLLYRYDRLGEAQKAAKREGRSGARYPFISSVTGEEKVWKHVRHPYMQYHVVADVAWGIINYYSVTGDAEFMRCCGLEMLSEISDYWVSAVELENGRYVINKVTGCDEHHPYVDNDAYTNYLVYYVLSHTQRLCKEFHYKVNRKWREVFEKLYLPMGQGGLIPQFDGYFDLSQSLECEGTSGAGFQMKNLGGLYHKSQIIKQPDVMLLFSYLPNDFDTHVYARNWDYYEAMCEASSSLTAPVHAICAFDNNQLYKGYRYFLQAAEMDIKNLHGDTANGIHAGCSAGAWYSIVRGMCGIEMHEDHIKIDPKMLPWWDAVSFRLKWHGATLEVFLDRDAMCIIPSKEIRVRYNGEDILVSEGKSFPVV